MLATPRRHREIDGSAMLQDGIEGPERLSEGATFIVNMKAGPIPYRTVNRCVEFEEGRRIAWVTERSEIKGKGISGGQRWGYIIEPEGEFTRLTHTYDVSNMATSSLVALVGLPDKMEKSMRETLEKIEQALKDA